MIVWFNTTVVSDSCYHGSAIDKSGPAIEELLKDNFGATRILRGVVPDEESKIIVCIYSHKSLQINSNIVIFILFS